LRLWRAHRLAEVRVVLRVQVRVLFEKVPSFEE